MFVFQDTRRMSSISTSENRLFKLGHARFLEQLAGIFADVDVADAGITTSASLAVEAIVGAYGDRLRHGSVPKRTQPE